MYEISQDSIDTSTRQFTFELSQVAYQGLQAGSSGHICNPQIGCNVCHMCCKTYLTNQFDCDACVAVKCS